MKSWKSVEGSVPLAGRASVYVRASSNRSNHMGATKRRYSKEEFARRGDRLVETKVRPSLKLADEDKFVAIDIETGEYELDKNEMKAVDRLRKRVPDSQIWVVHVSLGYLHRFGGQIDENQHPRRFRLAVVDGALSYQTTVVEERHLRKSCHER